MSAAYVLDASAVLALLNQEAGDKIVAAALGNPGTVISAVSYAEVVGKLANIGMPEDAIRAALEPLGLNVRGFDNELAVDSGLLCPATRNYGLSLGDRCCLALARHVHLPALTADKAWAELKVGVKVKVIR